MADVTLGATVAEPEAAPALEHPPLQIPQFNIVPRVGLAISIFVTALVIVAIAVNKLWPLTFFHVAGGAAWTIIDLFLGLDRKSTRLNSSH